MEANKQTVATTASSEQNQNLNGEKLPYFADMMYQLGRTT